MIRRRAKSKKRHSSFVRRRNNSVGRGRFRKTRSHRPLSPQFNIYVNNPPGGGGQKFGLLSNQKRKERRPRHLLEVRRKVLNVNLKQIDEPRSPSIRRLAVLPARVFPLIFLFWFVFACDLQLTVYYPRSVNRKGNTCIRGIWRCSRARRRKMSQLFFLANVLLTLRTRMRKSWETRMQNQQFANPRICLFIR